MVVLSLLMVIFHEVITLVSRLSCLSDQQWKPFCTFKDQQASLTAWSPNLTCVYVCATDGIHFFQSTNRGMIQKKKKKKT